MPWHFTRWICTMSLYRLYFHRLVKLDEDSTPKISEALMLDYLIMDITAIQTWKLYDWSSQLAVQITLFVLHILWRFLHILLSIWCQLSSVVKSFQIYLITAGVLKKYRVLDISKVKYLAIVVESEDAGQTSKIVELVRQVADIGVKRVCLYDMDGILKKSKETIMEECNAKAWKEHDSSQPLNNADQLTLEFVSFNDGREAIAAAASLILSKHFELSKQGFQEVPKITEKLVDESLRAVGGRGPNPDLLLVYGPARCHLGFPAWRITYSEIIHMGPLMDAKHGYLLKAIYKFTTVHQNYGL